MKCDGLFLVVCVKNVECVVCLVESEFKYLMFEGYVVFGLLRGCDVVDGDDVFVGDTFEAGACKLCVLIFEFVCDLVE